MTLELTERLKSVCNLMAEKMPEKFRYNEQTIETLTTWTAWTFSIPNRSAIIFFNGKEIQTTQDSIDLLASLLPEPRRFLLCDLIWDLDVAHDVFIGNMVGFYTKTFSINWKFKYCESMIMQKEPLDARVELICIEVERQLGK